MGCLNSTGDFDHWFGNIHLSGPCNRSCYFCIGQHMMSLDSLNSLDQFPLPGLDEFIKICNDHGVFEVNMTGTNTDPLLYKHTEDLKNYIQERIPELKFKIRTNAVKKDLELLKLYDDGSITICSFDSDIYKKMMGAGSPPDIKKIAMATKHWTSLKINIVLGDENVGNGDIHKTLKILEENNIQRVNLREPYGQPHIGNPLSDQKIDSDVFGNPTYKYKNGMNVTYWDVHSTEVESVNLYANGIISETYPITKGHDPIKGDVKSQDNFDKGRKNAQWLSYKKDKK